jgi:hypothetical protein
MVNEPRLGQRRSWSEVERRRDATHYYLTALNKDDKLPEELGAIFHTLADAGISPDEDAWTLAARMAPGAIGEGEVTDLCLDHAALIARKVWPFILRWKLPRSLGDDIFPGDWAIIRESYWRWYYDYRPAAMTLSDDERAYVRRKVSAWYRKGLRGRMGKDEKPEPPTLLEKDLWRLLGFRSPELLRAYRREFPPLLLSGEVYLAAEYGQYDRGRFTPTIYIQGEDFETPFDPERDDYAAAKAAFAAYQKRQQDEFERQALEILELAANQGLTERPTSYVPWRAAEAVYLRGVKGDEWKEIAGELSCDLSQIRREAVRMAELLGVEL